MCRTVISQAVIYRKRICVAQMWKVPSLRRCWLHCTCPKVWDNQLHFSVPGNLTSQQFPALPHPRPPFPFHAPVEPYAILALVFPTPTLWALLSRTSAHPGSVVTTNAAKAYRRDSKYLKKSLLLSILFLFMLCVELLFDFTECIRFMLCFVSNNEVNISINQYNQIYLSNFRFINEL